MRDGEGEYAKEPDELETQIWLKPDSRPAKVPAAAGIALTATRVPARPAARRRGEAL